MHAVTYRAHYSLFIKPSLLNSLNTSWNTLLASEVRLFPLSKISASTMNAVYLLVIYVGLKIIKSYRKDFIPLDTQISNNLTVILELHHTHTPHEIEGVPGSFNFYRYLQAQIEDCLILVDLKGELFGH